MRIFENRQKRLEFLQRNSKHKKNRKEIPDNVFKQCTECHASIPYVDLIKNDYVCPACGHHFKISAHERIRQLCDDGSFKEVDKRLKTVNIEDFEGYDPKLNRARQSTGLYEAVVCGTGRIHGSPCAVAVMDSNFMMGSMGVIVGEKITRTIELARRKKLPLLISCTSGGARMQEGIQSLVQMAKTSAGLKQFSNEGGLYISLLTHPTTGGVSASFAMLADIILAEPDCLIGFAGRRVIENTIGEELPKEFQRAEFMLEKGFVDAIVPRRELKETISTVLKLHGGK